MSERSVTSGHRILHKMYLQIHSTGTVVLKQSNRNVTDGLYIMSLRMFASFPDLVSGDRGHSYDSIEDSTD